MNQSFKHILFSLCFISTTSFASEQYSKNPFLTMGSSTPEDATLEIVSEEENKKEESEEEDNDETPNNTIIKINVSSNLNKSHPDIYKSISLLIEKSLNTKNKEDLKKLLITLLEFSKNTKTSSSTSNPETKDFFLSLQITNKTADDKDWKLILSHSEEIPALFEAMQAKHSDNKNEKETKKFYEQNAREILALFSNKSNKNEILMDAHLYQKTHAPVEKIVKKTAPIKIPKNNRK